MIFSTLQQRLCRLKLLGFPGAVKLVLLIVNGALLLHECGKCAAAFLLLGEKLVQRSALLQLRSDCQPLLVKGRFLRGGVSVHLLLPVNEACQHIQQKFSIFGLCAVLHQQFAFRKISLRRDLASSKGNAGVQRLALLVAIAVHVLQLEAHGLIKAGVEQLLEQLLAFLRGSVQDLQEITLGDHDGLGELILREPQQIVNLGVHFLQTIVVVSGFKADQFRVGDLRGGAIAGLLGAEIFRVAADRPGFAPVGKGEFHPGFIPGGCIIRPERLALAALLAAGSLSIQGKADRIKDGGFARAGIACDQKQTVFPQAREVNLRHTGIRSKGGHGELNGLHRAFPPVP